MQLHLRKKVVVLHHVLEGGEEGGELLFEDRHPDKLAILIRSGHPAHRHLVTTQN